MAPLYKPVPPQEEDYRCDCEDCQAGNYCLMHDYSRMQICIDEEQYHRDLAAFEDALSDASLTQIQAVYVDDGHGFYLEES